MKHRIGPLAKGTLVRRYKRFLADVQMDKLRTVHCPNPGSMIGMDAPGSDVLLSNEGDHRKYPWSLEMLRPPGRRSWIGCNAARANHIVRAALEAKNIPGLHGPISAEVPNGSHRFDFRVGDTWVEVKSVTLAAPTVRGAEERVHGAEPADHGPAEPKRAAATAKKHGRTQSADQPPNSATPRQSATPVRLSPKDARRLFAPERLAPYGNTAIFPDAVTERGRSHVEALASMARADAPAAMVFLVNRADCDRFASSPIDPAFGAALEDAARAGVQVVPVGVTLGPRGWSWRGALPWVGAYGPKRDPR